MTSLAARPVAQGHLPVARVAVVVPARDEEALLPACLRGIDAAVEQLRTRRPGVLVDVLVVLDGCRDGSAEVVARHGIRSITCDLGRVGAVRHLGAVTLLGDASGDPSHGTGPDGSARADGADGVDGADIADVADVQRLRSTWLACTDADSTVPPGWLLTQLDLADAGADLVVGTVEPIGHPDPEVVRVWRARHDLIEGHQHVHGANLGIRGSTYAAIGGFAPVPLHEDADLVERARDAGARVLATDLVRVGSSARSDGRCPGGFADYIAELEREVG